MSQEELEVKEGETKGSLVGRAWKGATKFAGRVRSAGVAEFVSTGVMHVVSSLKLNLSQEPDDVKFTPEDPKEKFEDACKAINEYLTNIANEYGLPEDEISATYQQLQKKEVTISTHGRHSCGKSTLLNALLDDSLLPISLENNTGVRVTIKHSDSVHQGMCPSPTPCERCPTLEIWTGDSGDPQTEHGTKAVRDALEEINKESRKPISKVDKPLSQAMKCTLTTSFPKLSGVEHGWKLSILDNPGYGEADQDRLMQETETTMKTSSALLYIMDVGQLQDKEDACRLQELHTADEGIFADSSRLTIAVTQFDKTYDYRPEEWTVVAVQTKLCTFIEHEIGKKIQPDVVIPVCGKWASEARQLKQHQDDAKLKARVMAGLLVCSSAPDGQESMIEWKTAEIMADRLLHKTGIEALEERIQMMASACVHTWVSSLTQKYHNYLEMAVKHINMSYEAASEQLKCAEESHLYTVRDYEQLTDLRGDLEDKTLLQKLQQQCEKDVTAAKETAMCALVDFHEQCRSKIEAKKEDFGPKEYEHEIGELFKTKFSVQLSTTVFDSSSGFKLGWKARNDAIVKMEKDFRCMKKAAEKFLASSSEENVPASVDITKKENLRSVCSKGKLTFQIDDFKEKVYIPDLDLSWGQRFKKGLWWCFSYFKIIRPPIYSYSSAECVAETMEQTKSYLEDSLCSYLQGLELSVARHFFSRYHKNTENHLKFYDERYKDRVEDKKKAGDEHISELKRSLQVIEEEKNFVRDIKLRLLIASKKFE